MKPSWAPRGSVIGKLALASVSLLLSLASAEVLLRCRNEQPWERKKAIVSLPSVFGHCYSSDPKRYWPVSLRESAVERERLRALLPAREAERLISETPYCIFYDVAGRQRGFRPGVNRQAALVGDSFCFGEGLRDEDTLGYLLSQQYGDWNFQNYGLPGADVGEVHGVVTNLLNRKDGIDSIFYVYNLNDVVDEKGTFSKRVRLNDLQNVRWAFSQESLSPLETAGGGSYVWMLFRKANAFRAETRRSVGDYVSMYLSSGNERSIGQTIDLIDDMQRRCVSQGVQFAVVLYPLLYKDWFGRYPFTKIHEELTRRCEGKAVRCIDVYPAIAGQYDMSGLTVHAADYHPNGRANGAVAEYLHAGDRLRLGHTRDGPRGDGR